MDSRTRAGATAASGTPASPNVDIAAQLSSLEHLDLDALRSRWLKVTGRPAPRVFRTDLLRKALAHEIQTAAFGGLPAAVKRRLRDLAVAAREGRFDEALGTPSIKPGTLLVRVWQGTNHRMMVTDDGFAWNGKTYRSLSSIAKAITGTNWNGWLFFGLKRSDGRNKNATKAKPEAGTLANA